MSKVKFKYAAYEKGTEKCVARADTAKELAEMLHITSSAVYQRVCGVTDQSRSKYTVVRNPAQKIASEKESKVQKAKSDSDNKPALDFGKICKALRAHMGINQEDFARVINSYKCEVYHMEHGFIPGDESKVEKVLQIAKRVGII